MLELYHVAPNFAEKYLLNRSKRRLVNDEDDGSGQQLSQGREQETNRSIRYTIREALTYSQARFFTLKARDGSGVATLYFPASAKIIEFGRQISQKMLEDSISPVPSHLPSVPIAIWINVVVQNLQN
jgi:hypothetical protein